MPYVPLPRVTEPVEELLEQRRVERDERQRERLHLLELVARGVEGSRSALARRLGRNRETISAWLETYAQEGLAGLLRAPKSPGPLSQGGIGLPEATKAAIRARLAKPQGERGCQALWQWARAEHAVTYSYPHFTRWVHAHLGATLKVARKSHGQKKTKHSRPAATRV